MTWKSVTNPREYPGPSDISEGHARTGRCGSRFQPPGQPDENRRGASKSVLDTGFHAPAVAAPGSPGDARTRHWPSPSWYLSGIAPLFLDGKTFAEDMMVAALGVTITGEKRILGFVETGTENEQVLTPFLRSLVDRGLDVSQGLLVVIDGSKGLRAAVRKAFRNKALLQRCQWHKRENVVSYLPRGEQAAWRRRLQRAYERTSYGEAKAALERIRGDLEKRNQSAAASLAEGFEETLTLHRLGVFGVLGRSLKTTNCLESIHSLVEERCAKVDCWKNSRQRHRWLVAALLDIDRRLRRVMGYRLLPKHREALARELKIGRRNNGNKVKVA